MVKPFAFPFTRVEGTRVEGLFHGHFRQITSKKLPSMDYPFGPAVIMEQFERFDALQRPAEGKGYVNGVVFIVEGFVLCYQRIRTAAFLPEIPP